MLSLDVEGVVFGRRNTGVLSTLFVRRREHGY
jgi:hypothetical protein